MPECRFEAQAHRVGQGMCGKDEAPRKNGRSILSPEFPLGADTHGVDWRGVAATGCQAITEDLLDERH